MTTAITPPATIGVVGGGLLARHLVMAANSMGYRTAVLDPDPGAPAGSMADLHIVAPYDDPDALERLGDTCAVVTTGCDHVPSTALEHLERRAPVRPSPSVVAVCEDRIAEKRFLESIGVPVAPWQPITTLAELHAVAESHFPAVLTTARPGGDGASPASCDHHDDAEVAWRRFGEVPCVLERRLTVDRHLSVVLARSTAGEITCHPVAEDRHVNGVLDSTAVPADLPGDGHQQAAELCGYIAERLDIVGVLAVTMLVVGNDVHVDRLAPRPHEAGRYTLDACATSQFEQHVRAVCGLGLGDPTLLVASAATVNLLGELRVLGEPDWSAVLADQSAHLHLGTTSETRTGHTIGHLTVTSASGAGTLARRLRQQAASAHQR